MGLRFLIVPLLIGQSIAKCYEPTIAHPLPKYDADEPLLRNAFEHVKALLTLAIEPKEHANTSFSIEVTSSQETLWSHHHTARARNASRPDIPEVNGTGLYRIASITKVFTVLGILQQHAAGNLSLDDPVNKYLAGLHGKQHGHIPWKDITLRSLASQLSGIPREFAQSDLANSVEDTEFDPVDMGLPPVPDPGLGCDENDHYKHACNSTDLFRIVGAQEPLFAPNQQSTYSNVAFELLGLVIANVTKQPYESYVQEAIFDFLEMTTSTLSLPPDSKGVIPLKPHYWDVDAGVQNPTGGIYTSSQDMSKFLRHVLTHYNGLTHALNWFNPVSPTANLGSFYGLPWEMYHTDRILLNSRRTVRFITKSGGLPGYTSIIILAPEYDLGITILVAGPSSVFEQVRDIVTGEVIRAAQQLVIAQLQERYQGQFIAPTPKLNSSLSLIADARGLIVDSFISNSSDVLETLIPYLARHAPRDSYYVQLVPTLLNRDEKAQAGERWRMLVVPKRPEEDSSQDAWDEFCMTDVDQLAYGRAPLNEAVLWEGRQGFVDDVELTGFRVNLTRIIRNVGGIGDVPLQEVMEL